MSENALVWGHGAARLYPSKPEIANPPEMAYARRRDDATAVQSPAEVVRVKTLPRRMLLQDERPEIDALTRLIGPAFRAAQT